MLGDGHTRRRAQNRGGGGDVEGAKAIAARANDVENLARLAPVFFNRRRDGFLAQRGRKRGDFLVRLAFLREGDEEIRLCWRGNSFVRQKFDGLAHLLRRQGLRGGKLF